MLHQGIADAARTEGDQKGRGEVLEAASLILDTEMVAKVGKSATHIIEAKKAVVERASVTIQAQQRRLNAARILGFKA